MSAAEEYIKGLGVEVEAILGDGFKFFKTNQLLKRKTDCGLDVVSFLGSNKNSPNIYVGFAFGKKYSEAEKLQKMLGLKPSYYEIFQNSYNIASMENMNYSESTGWDINIHSPPENLALEIANSIEGVAYPFFNRFHNPVDARNALESNDSWCLLTSHRSLLCLNAMLNELDRFESWAESSLEGIHYDVAVQELQKMRQVNEI